MTTLHLITTRDYSRVVATLDGRLHVWEFWGPDHRREARAYALAM